MLSATADLTLSSVYHLPSSKDRHDDTSKDWYLVKDFELEYKDWTGANKGLTEYHAKQKRYRTSDVHGTTHCWLTIRLAQNSS